jgi:hypothetical protein
MASYAEYLSQQPHLQANQAESSNAVRGRRTRSPSPHQPNKRTQLILFNAEQGSKDNVELGQQGEGLQVGVQDELAGNVKGDL